MQKKNKTQEQEIQKIAADILKHKALYYQGRPEISDYEYDRLEDRLRELNPTHPLLELVGSITPGHVSLDQVSSGSGQLPGGRNAKIKHDTKMLSLDKTYQIQDIVDWGQGEDLVSTLKIDGVSCSLLYEKGRLKVAKTRGDGNFGEDILAKVFWIEDIPKQLGEVIQNGDLRSVEIRGELFCPRDQFVKLVEEMDQLELERPTSMRNIVAGLMGRKDRAYMTLCRYLKFFAFELIDAETSWPSEFEKLKKLESLGFRLPQAMLVQKGTFEEIQKAINETRIFFDKGDFQIDGVVFTYDDLEKQRSMGFTSHHPRFKLAFKFLTEVKAALINEIEWSISRNGVLSPIALIEPIELSGAKISRVMLHNLGMVKTFNLKAHDTIEVTRSGEVIPKFLSVLKSSEGEYTYPQQCPVCQHTTTIQEIRLFCLNPNCAKKNLEEILHYVKHIGIDDLSVKRLQQLVDLKLVGAIPDIYDLTQNDLLKVDKFKEKLANKIHASIRASCHVDLLTFVTALGLTGGGEASCLKIINSGYGTLDQFINLSEEELIAIDGFAEKSAHDLVTSIKLKKELVQRLLDKGVKVKSAQLLHNRDKQSSLAGKKICITGTLSVTRSQMEKYLQEKGLVVQKSVSSSTDFLLTNDLDTQSSKFKKAQQLKVTIVNEQKLKDLLSRSSNI